MEEFNTVALGFLDYCEGVKKLKPDSLKDIKCTLRKLQRYLDEQNSELEAWEMDLAHFTAYINYLRDRGERGTGVSKQLSQIRGYINYCWRIGRATKNPLDGFDLKDDSPVYVSRCLSIEEVTKLLEQTSRKSRIERKDRLIILMLYGLGLRTGELCHMKTKDISIEDQDVFVKGKFDVERRIPIPDGVWVELLAYLQENQAKCGYLFRTEVKKTKLGIAEVGDILRKYVIPSGLDGVITPKVLRHTFASHLIDQGVDISIISSLMGHKTPNETGIYLHAFEKNKNQAVMSMESILNEED